MDFPVLISMLLKVSMRSFRDLYHTDFLVRTTRTRIIYLRNDYKALMDVVEKKVHEMFAEQARNTSSESSTSTEAHVPTQTLPSRPPVLEPPFAKVNSVVDGSPADSAGLKAGDEIRNFGYVNRSNHDNLRRVADCVQGNEGVSNDFHFMQLSKDRLTIIYS